MESKSRQSPGCHPHRSPRNILPLKMKSPPIVLLCQSPPMKRDWVPCLSIPAAPFRAALSALMLCPEKTLWKTRMIKDSPRETAEAKFGPSGAAIWSAPTIDTSLNQLYVTTGDAYSTPADIATDAVIGMNLVSGEILWRYQGTADDIWTVACMTPNALPECGPDQDFGSPAILVSQQTQLLPCKWSKKRHCPSSPKGRR